MQEVTFTLTKGETEYRITDNIHHMCINKEVNWAKWRLFVPGTHFCLSPVLDSCLAMARKWSHDFLQSSSIFCIL